MSEARVIDTPLRGIELADSDGNLTGDRILPWSHNGFDGAITPAHGVDLWLDGRKVEVRVTRRRKKLSIWVDGVRYEPVTDKGGGE